MDGPRAPREDGSGLRLPWAHTDRFLPRTMLQPLQAFLETSIASSLLLLAAVVAALIWANAPWSGSYHHVLDTQVGLGVGTWRLEGSVHFWINEGLMTFFFLVVGLEIKRELTVGELRRFRAAVLPVVAALGGMVLPALLYLAVAGGSAARQGWGVPMATDIAFALGALTMAAVYAPPSLKPLLLTLAIVDDIGAIVVIAVFYAGGLRLFALEEALAMVILIVILRSIHVRWVAAYAVVGTLLWYFTYRSGVHPTIAGVILGLLTPAVPFQRPATVSEQARSTAEATTDHPDPPDADAEAWLRLSRLSREAVSPLARLEGGLLPWTSFVILPIFALANAGVELSSAALRASATSAVAIGIVLGLVIGKPLGVLVASWIACRTAVATLPVDVGWGDLAGMGAVAGVGFTMGLFIAELAFDPGLQLDEAKIAILFASVLAAALGYVVLRISPNRSPAG